MQRSGDYLLKISYFSGQMNTDVSFFCTGGIKMYVQFPRLHDSAVQQEKTDKQGR
ncbi:TPA: helicase DnaB [Morganella morganii]|nr:helicase DnaB [Morganella morganii]HAT1525896.1 helicase DnaB [Morganella morganii]